MNLVIFMNSCAKSGIFFNIAKGQGEKIMNEETIYSEMLEIPVNTCSITYTAPKRRKKKKEPRKEDVKELAIEKVNRELEAEKPEDIATEMPESEPVAAEAEKEEEKPVAKKKFKVSVIGVQLAVVVALLGVIVLSNLFMPNSGLSVFLNSVFNTQTEQADVREYNSFAPMLPMTDGEVAVDGGVMTFAAKGSIYSPCDGEITALTADENGKYTIEITHSTKFKTVISGIDYAYQELGSQVYGNIPLGYSLGEGIELCFYGADGERITTYTVDNETDRIIWEV